MRIGCLAWGSLIWDPRQLPLASEWFSGGPELPIEFARVGGHGELATALCPGAARMPTRWAELRCDDLQQARELLREREEIPPFRPHYVGSAAALQARTPPLVEPRDALRGDEIATWGRAVGLDAVVWTASPPRFDDREGHAPAAAEAVAYLRGLAGAASEHARNYVERVPAEIRTPCRALIEAELGWVAKGA